RHFVELEGIPDWVMEIISAAAVLKDTQLLRQAYHRAGIPEYWLIDARGEELIFHILHWRKDGYRAAPIRNGWQRSRVFNHDFRRPRRRDRRGMCEYTLEMRVA